MLPIVGSKVLALLRFCLFMAGRRTGAGQAGTLPRSASFCSTTSHQQQVQAPQSIMLNVD